MGIEKYEYPIIYLHKFPIWQEDRRQKTEDWPQNYRARNLEFDKIFEGYDGNIKHFLTKKLSDQLSFDFSGEVYHVIQFGINN